MNIVKKNEENKLVFYLNGELDHHVADRVRKILDLEIESLRPKDVIFDFSNLSFMDSTGIGILLGRYKKLKEYGAAVYARGAQNMIDKLLKLSGIYNIFIKI